MLSASELSFASHLRSRSTETPMKLKTQVLSRDTGHLGLRVPMVVFTLGDARHFLDVSVKI